MRKIIFVMLIGVLLSACSGALATMSAATVTQPEQQATEAPSTVAQRSATLTLAPTDAPEPTVTVAPTNTPQPPTSTATAALTTLPRPTAIRTPAPPTASAFVEAQVVKIVDGDTIDVSIGGKTYPLRYIGINTPKDTTQHEPYGPEATAKNRELVQGKTVRLEKDVSETDR